MKKRLLVILPLFLLVACGDNKENLSKVKYQYGNDAVAIQQDLQNKLQVVSEQKMWSQFQIKENASFKAKITMDTAVNEIVTDSNSLTLSEMKGSLNFDLKLGYGVTTNTQPSVQANLKAFVKLESSTNNNGQMKKDKTEVSADAKYGVSSIKKEQNSEPTTTDFLFAKVTEKTNGNDNTYGVLFPDLMSSMKTPAQPGPSEGTPSEGNVTIDETVIANILNEVGFAKKGDNKYYMHIDLAKLPISLDGSNSTASLNLTGNYYISISFNDDNTLKAIETQGKKIAIQSAQDGVKFDFELDTEMYMGEYTGKIDLPTQKDVDDLGYENLVDTSTTI